MKRFVFAAFAAGALLAGCATPGPQADDVPPPAPREFRGAWVASVANIDWPSRPGLPVAAQQDEIVRIVERAQRIGLNALIVQVRPAADALYPSDARAVVRVPHRRRRARRPSRSTIRWRSGSRRRTAAGIELHAWFNPYRARHPAAKSAARAQTTSRTRRRRS